MRNGKSIDTEDVPFYTEKDVLQDKRKIVSLVFSWRTVLSGYFLSAG